MAAALFKIDKDEVKKVVGSILGGDQESELDFKKSYDKFLLMHSIVDRFRKVIMMLSKSTIISHFEYDKKKLDIFYEKLVAEMEAKFNHAPPAAALADMYPIIPKDCQEKALEFLRYYNECKKASIIHVLIKTCNNLVAYDGSLKEIDKLSDSFLVNSSMMTFEPIAELTVNFKQLYISNLITDSEKKFLLLTLHKVYTISMEMFEAYGKADIDTENFVKAVNITVDKLKKQIPRCDQAFKKILESTDLLRERYDDYYKDFIGSNNNSMIIAENFISDVAQSVDKSPVLAQQFRKIINHLKSMTAKLMATDPKYRETFSTLMNHADSSYAEIKKSMKEEDNIDLDEDEDGEIAPDLTLGGEDDDEGEGTAAEAATTVGFRQTQSNDSLMRQVGEQLRINSTKNNNSNII